MSKTVYLVDVGVLLDDTNEEFKNYANVYDKKYGYYDEEQHYESTLESATKYAKEYVEEGNDSTYGIVSVATLNDYEDVEEANVKDESYLVSDVEFSCMKKDGEIICDFIQKS